MTVANEKKFQRQVKKDGNSRPATRFNGNQFINYELNKAQTAELKAQPNDANKLFASLEGLINDGYKLTVKYDERNECFASFLFAPDDGGANSGFILTGRGSSCVKAVKQLLYKHFVCLPNGWSEFAERPTGMVIDD